MRAVVQRVDSASVTIDGKVNGKIGKGFMVLIALTKTTPIRILTIFAIS